MNAVSSIQSHSVPLGVAAERTIDTADVRLEATLAVPPVASAAVILLHASSAGRFAASSRFAAEVFAQSGLATLQVDLLTPQEEAGLPATNAAALTALLRPRVLAVVDWLQMQPETQRLALGLFASKLETTSAMLVSATVPGIGAVVSQGGYPDSGDDAPAELLVPTLMILGRDEQTRAAELAVEFFARNLCVRS